MSIKELRINNGIRTKEVRLIDEDGEQKGVISIKEALELAETAGLDLVEVAPGANPPVCKIIDYGKYRFEQEKQQRENKKKQKQIKLKEIRMQPKIDDHDLKFKSKHISDFLAEGNKVKVTIRFRGRELAHLDRGRMVLDKLLEMLDEDLIVDKSPAMEGRFMSMILRPKK